MYTMPVSPNSLLQLLCTRISSDFSLMHEKSVFVIVDAIRTLVGIYNFEICNAQNL